MANGSRGILLDATLQDGSRFAGDGFRMVLTTTGIGPSGTTSSLTATNFKPVMPLWPTNTANNLPTKFTVAYQPIFGTPLGQANNSADLLEAMMQNVVIAANARWSNPGVEPGDATTPKMLWNQSDFTDWLVQNIRKEEVRNLFYFGHGGPSGIGSTNTVPVTGQLSGSLTRRLIQQALNNTPATVGTSSSNAHPYRFVFLYGCSTANGELPLAFGIPKKVGMKKIDFLKNGLRPQAFVGWSDWKVVGFSGFLNDKHSEFVSQFFVNWKNSTYPSGHPKAGFHLGLKDALDKTAVAVGWTGWFFNPYNDLVIYGAEDLTFDDYYDPTP